jgi:hypothetical protein
MMVTSGTRMSLTGECKYNKICVFAYTYSWARLVFILILWHIRGKLRIVMAFLKLWKIVMVWNQITRKSTPMGKGNEKQPGRMACPETL